MDNQSASHPPKKPVVALSRLLLSPIAELQTEFAEINKDEFDELVALASSNHVIVRGMEVFCSIMRGLRDDVRARWAEDALLLEQARIHNAIPCLRDICDALEEHGYAVAVIKSLDHWPDLGSDLDLYTGAESWQVSQVMKSRFQAAIAPRSWGDRLACKWNFLLPGLPEAVEVHVGRLGQTGEQVRVASRLIERSRTMEVGGFSFRVPAISDRLMISVLQRMYRHFYFRLCDIIDTAELVEAELIDYEELRRSATAAGIWEGVATYLAIVSDYVQMYRSSGLSLPAFITSSARFGGDQIYFRRDFLRVPILPQAASLYKSQIASLLRRKEFVNSARLGLLPWLATAAIVGQKFTGSDKGIW